MTETKTTEDLKTGTPPDSTPAPPPPDKKEGPPELTPIESLPEDIQKHIRELRTEARDNRIAAREAKERFEKMDEEFQQLRSSFEEKSGALEEYEKKKKEKELAEASEIEKLQIQMNELRESLEKAEQTVALKDGEITLLETKQIEGKIINLVDEMVNQAGYQYKPYQRPGLLQIALSPKEDGSYKSSAEVREIVEQFLEDNKETPPSPPGPGGKEKTTQVPVSDELNNLIDIGKQRMLTTEEYSRFNELHAELNKSRGIV